MYVYIIKYMYNVHNYSIYTYMYMYMHIAVSIAEENFVAAIWILEQALSSIPMELTKNLCTPTQCIHTYMYNYYTLIAVNTKGHFCCWNMDFGNRP